MKRFWNFKMSQSHQKNKNKNKNKHLNAMLFTFKMVAILQTREKSLKIFSSFFPLNLQVSPPTPAWFPA